MEPPLTSLQQTPPRPPAAVGSDRRPALALFACACRILARAHGSPAPGSSCPGGDGYPLRGALHPVQAESIAAPRAAMPEAFSRYAARLPSLSPLCLTGPD